MQQQHHHQHQQQPSATGEGGQARVVGRWVLAAHIGSGSFAVVWRARHAETGAEAAVKEINLDRLNAKLRQSLESEVSILKRIRHANIVRLLEVVEVRAGGGGRSCARSRRPPARRRALTPAHPPPRCHPRSAPASTW